MRKFQIPLRLFWPAVAIAVAVNFIGYRASPIVFWMKDYWPAKVVQDGLVEAKVSGWKLKECDFISGSEQPYIYFTDRAGWSSKNVYFNFITTAIPASRPVGRHDFGVWQWHYNPDRTPAKVMLRVKHVCSGGHVQYTDIGPFRVR